MIAKIHHLRAVRRFLDSLTVDEQALLPRIREAGGVMFVDKYDRAGIRYRGYLIKREDWGGFDYEHVDYDGAPYHAYDAPSDIRCGQAFNLAVVIDEIDALEEIVC